MYEVPLINPFDDIYMSDYAFLHGSPESQVFND